MSRFHFVALDSQTAAEYRDGGRDAHGMSPQRTASPEGGAPCRHCLAEIGADEPFLIVAHRPFAAAGAYAEVGPIFLHAEACERYPETDAVPEMFLKRSGFLIRGYDRRHRIVYRTGARIDTDALTETATRLLDDPEVSYLHLRSAAYNCYQCRIDRT